MSGHPLSYVLRKPTVLTVDRSHYSFFVFVTITCVVTILYSKIYRLTMSGRKRLRGLTISKMEGRKLMGGIVLLGIKSELFATTDVMNDL